MLKDHLSENLYLKITTFSTGEDCLRNLDLNPEVIILDFNLNSVKKDAKNGIEILKEIKEKNPNIDVVMLSGQDKIDVAVETMKHGAFDYVIKNESAFKRTENVVFNIFKSIKLKEMLKIYRIGFFTLAVGIVIIIAVAILLRILGIASDDVYWM